MSKKQIPPQSLKVSAYKKDQLEQAKQTNWKKAQELGIPKQVKLLLNHLEVSSPYQEAVISILDKYKMKVERYHGVPNIVALIFIDNNIGWKEMYNDKEQLCVVDARFIDPWMLMWGEINSYIEQQREKVEYENKKTLMINMFPFDNIID